LNAAVRAGRGTKHAAAHYLTPLWETQSEEMAAAVARLNRTVSTDAFRQHPDYQINSSFPGLGESTGARVLAEIGDDPLRFTDAREPNAFAGSAPITRASGRSTSITHRRRRLLTSRFLSALFTTCWANRNDIARAARCLHINT
jgi:transposase